MGRHQSAHRTTAHTGKDPTPSAGLRLRHVHWILRIAVFACYVGHGAFGIITKAAWVPYFGFGAKPDELPVERPTTFDFAVNLKAARALGLTIPPSVLQQATEIMQ